MGRKKRVWYPGATYHVMSRGNRRTALFKENSDYLRFLDCIQQSKKIYSFDIHAICLMTNHFHMLIETKDKELWKIMHRILHPYSMCFNQKYSYTGHLFENRYTACIVEDERYFLEVSRYIHLNPVKALMVRSPIDYLYSSYQGYMSFDEAEEKLVKKMIDGLVDKDRVLGAFANNSKEQYRMFVEGKISHEEQELLIQKDIKEDEKWLPW